MSQHQDESGESESEYESGSSSESEDEEEPIFKFKTIKRGAQTIIRDYHSQPSAMCATDKFVVIGSNNGDVFILDAECNVIVKELRAQHALPVTGLSVDTKMEHIASCDQGGKVIVRDVFDFDPVEFEFERPLLCVAIDPEYDSKRFVRCAVGGKEGIVYLAQKKIVNIFGKRIYRDNKVIKLITQSQGTIYHLSWRKDILIWVSDEGIYGHNTATSQRIRRIKKPSRVERGDRVDLYWLSDTKFIFSWGVMLEVAEIVPESSDPEVFGDLKRVLKCALDSPIMAIAPYFNDIFVLVAGELDEENGHCEWSEPAVQIYSVSTTPGQQRVEFVNSSYIPFKNFEQLQPMHYQLAAMPDDRRYIIATPFQVVIAEETTIQGRIEWHFEKDMFHEGLKLALDNSKDLAPEELADFYDQFMEHLNEENLVDEGTEYLPQIAGKNKATWEKWILWFMSHNALSSLALKIPVAEPLLGKQIYSDVLNYFLSHDKTIFFQLLQGWPNNIYDQDELRAVVQSAYDREGAQNKRLAESYAYMLVEAKQYSSGFDVYLECRSERVFDLIRKHELFGQCQAKVRSLLAVDADKTVALLVEDDMLKIVSPDQVMQQMANDRPNTLKYLEVLLKKHTKYAREFGSKFVTLAASIYDDARFRRLLESYINVISIRDAFAVCKSQEKWMSLAYLYEKQHQINDAVMIMVDKLENVHMAIDLVLKESQDKYWKFLIETILKKKRPDFILALLERAGTHIDPSLILNNELLLGVEVPGLRDAVIKIISDYQVQIALSNGCQKIMIKDCAALQRRFIAIRRQPMHVRPDHQACVVCQQLLSMTDTSMGGHHDDVVIFACGHVYHRRCLIDKLESLQQAKQAMSTSSKRRREPLIPTCLQCDSEDSRRSRQATRRATRGTSSRA